jgi:hypothetical protein
MKEFWAIVELMGHVSLAGRVTEPENGNLYRIDIFKGDDYRTEYFGGQAVYRMRPVSEEIARAASSSSYDIKPYDLPIVSREEHERVVGMLRDRIAELDRPALDDGEEDDWEDNDE